MIYGKRKKRIVLVAPRSPEIRHSGDYVTGGVTDNVPLGLYNLKTAVWCSTFAKEVEIIVAGKEVSQNYGDYALLQWILSYAPDIVGFGSYVWNEARNDALAAHIKAASPNTYIIGGGPRFLHDAEIFLTHHLNYDAAIVGEGEETFVELLDFLITNNRDPSNILGLVWRDGDRVIVNSQRKLIEPLDMIPSLYLNGVCDLKEWGTLDLESQRGCPWNCSYCAYAGAASVQKGSRVRFFSIERIIAEFELALECKVRHAYFVDPDFLSKKARAIELCQALASVNREHSIHIHVELRAETVDEEVAEALWSAGIHSVEVGLQSIYSEVASISGRRNNLDRVEFGVRALRSKGIAVHVGVIVGLPKDNGTSGIKTVQWIENLGAKADIFLLSIIQGSRFWKEADKLGLEYMAQLPHYVVDNSVMEQAEIADSLAECLRTLSTYEDRRAVGM